MALLRGFEDHEYWPEYGTFLLRDAPPPTPAPEPVRVRVDSRLTEYAVDTQPCGSVARAGAGWLDGQATDRHHSVRLESHDEPPEPDPGDWAVVVETPLATAGRMGLAVVTGGYGSTDPFRIGHPGLYRVRFHRRPAPGGDGDQYLVQFWPVESPIDPPRWLRRDKPLVRPGSTDLELRSSEARSRYCYAISDLLSLVLWAGEGRVPVTVHWLADRLLSDAETVREILRHAVGFGLLEPYPVDAGPDDRLDLTVRSRESKRAAAQPPRPAGAARPAKPAKPAKPAQTPQPARPAEAAQPAKAQSAASPPTGKVGPSQLAPSLSAVARRLGGLSSEGTPSDERTQKIIMAGRLRALGPRSGGRREPPSVPVGPPPRAGVLGMDGNLTVWHDGEPMVVAHCPGGWTDAWQSRHGTVLLGNSQAALVRPDGELHLLASGVSAGATVDPSGNLLAVVESRHGRRSRARLHLFDLADGSRRTMSREPVDEHLSVVAAHAGAVYFRAGWLAKGTLRWTPGQEPEQLPHAVYQIDPYTGTGLARDPERPEPSLVDADGTARRLPADSRAALAPGATRLFLFRWSTPPALVLFDVADPESETVLPLPGGSRLSEQVPGGPVWEDPEHLLVPAEHATNDLGLPLVRLDLATGKVQAVPLPERAGYRPILIRPCPGLIT